MKIITFLNEKGGVGKTTLTTHVAADLALRGRRVLLIDADAQANSTVSLGLNEEPGLYNLLKRNAPWKDLLRQVHPDVYSPPETQAAGQLWCLPANDEVRLIPMAVSDDYVFVKRVAELNNVFDFIIIDTSPTPSMLHPRLIIASHYVLLPTELEALSAIDGLESTLENIGNIRDDLMKKGIDLARPIGIIPNKYRRKTVAHSRTLEYIQRKHGDLVWEPIDMAIAFAEASLMRQLLTGVGSDTHAMTQIRQVVDRIQQVVEMAL